MDDISFDRHKIAQLTEGSSREQVGTLLELLENIISRMPFPSILNARALSQSWRSRFTPLSSQRDEEKKRAAASFQALVCEQSQNWESFFPFCITQQSFLAYHQASQKSLILPSLEPDVYFKNRRGLRMSQWISGALLFSADWGTRFIYLANILTGRSRKLPAIPSPIEVGQPISQISLWDTSLATYRIIFVEYISEIQLCVCHYESKSDEWVEKLLGCGPNGYLYGATQAYFNGILYSAPCGNQFENMFHLEAINVEEGTLGVLHLSIHSEIDEDLNWIEIALVVCNEQLLMMVNGQGTWEELEETPHVLKIDLVSREMLEVGHVPPSINGDKLVSTYKYWTPVSVGPCILFPAEDGSIQHGRK